MTTGEESAFIAGAEAMREILTRRFPQIRDSVPVSADSLLISYIEEHEKDEK